MLSETLLSSLTFKIGFFSYGCFYSIFLVISHPRCLTHTSVGPESKTVKPLNNSSTAISQGRWPKLSLYCADSTIWTSWKMHCVTSQQKISHFVWWNRVLCIASCILLFHASLFPLMFPHCVNTWILNGLLVLRSVEQSTEAWSGPFFNAFVLFFPFPSPIQNIKCCSVCSHGTHVLFLTRTW